MRMRTLRNTKGFTLIELMIVVVIIGILAALAIPRFGAASARAKEKEADGILKAYYTMQHAYSARSGNFATTNQLLQEIGWEPPPVGGLRYYQPITADQTTPKVMQKIGGMTGFCDRQIDMQTGDISSTACN